MSKAKELRTSPENNINLYEWFSLFVPENKSKYVDVFLKTLKNTKNMDVYANELTDKFVKEFNLPKERLENMNKMHLIFLWRILDGIFDYEDLKTFQRFCEYNERNLIKQNDLSKYHDFDEIKNAVSIADIIANEKNMEKQIKVVYDDDTWLLLRPLTFASSKKYGSNTKWCTTQENNPDYFNKYSKKGVLIYCINKITGYKVASFYSLQKEDPEFSFWNQQDQRIDSLDSELPEHLRKLIKDISKDKNAKTNKFLLPETERFLEETLYSKTGSLNLVEPVPAEQDVARPIRVRNMDDRDIIVRENETEIATLNYQPLEQNENSLNSETE